MTVFASKISRITIIGEVVMVCRSPEFGSGGSGGGGSYLIAFLFSIPGLFLLSASTVLLFTIGLEN